MSRTLKSELLCPAGSLRKLKTAVLFGANAVYAGVPDFSLRARVNDFTREDIIEGVKICHQAGVRFYATLNIFAHNKHFDKMGEYVSFLRDAGVDALIVADPGVIEEVRLVWPTAEIHLSTQANTINWRAAEFWYKQGVQRIVLGREVSLADVKEIKKRVSGLEIECFVHGAMCMAYSGRCFLSRYFTGRSANLGDCAQACRWQYEIKTENHAPVILEEDASGSYILNSYDLCLVDKIPELIDVKIDSLKIEGRAKSVYYLSCITGIYRSAIDICLDDNIGDDEKKERLDYLRRELDEKLVSRGYTHGFMFGEGEVAQNLENSHNDCAWEFCGEVLECKQVGMQFQARVKVHNSIIAGDFVEIVSPPYAVTTIEKIEFFAIDSGEQMQEAHGGQNAEMIIYLQNSISAGSVMRRFINSVK